MKNLCVCKRCRRRFIIDPTMEKCPKCGGSLFVTGISETVWDSYNEEQRSKTISALMDELDRQEKKTAGADERNDVKEREQSTSADARQRTSENKKTENPAPKRISRRNAVIIAVAAAAVLVFCALFIRRRKSEEALLQGNTASSTQKEQSAVSETAMPEITEPILPEFHLKKQELYTDNESKISLSGKSELTDHALVVKLVLENHSEKMRILNITECMADGLNIPCITIGYAALPGDSTEVDLRLERGALEAAGIGDIKGLSLQAELLDEAYETVFEFPRLRTDGYDAAVGDYLPVEKKTVYQDDELRTSVLGVRISDTNYDPYTGERMPEEHNFSIMYLLIENDGDKEVVLSDDYQNPYMTAGEDVDLFAWGDVTVPPHTVVMSDHWLNYLELKKEDGSAATLHSKFSMESADGSIRNAEFAYSVEDETFTLISSDLGDMSGNDAEAAAPSGTDQGSQGKVLYKDGRYVVSYVSSNDEDDKNVIYSLRLDNSGGQKIQAWFGHPFVNGIRVPGDCVMTEGNLMNTSAWQLRIPRDALQLAGIDRIGSLKFSAAVADETGEVSRMSDLSLTFPENTVRPAIPAGERIFDGPGGMTMESLGLSASSAEETSDQYSFYFTVQNPSSYTFICNPFLKAGGWDIMPDPSSDTVYPFSEGIYSLSIPKSGLGSNGLQQLSDAELNLIINCFEGERLIDNTTLSLSYSAADGRFSAGNDMGSALEDGAADTPPADSQETSGQAATGTMEPSQEEAAAMAAERAEKIFQPLSLEASSGPPEGTEGVDYIRTTLGSYIKKPGNMSITDLVLTAIAENNSKFSAVATAIIYNPPNNPSMTNTNLHYKMYGENDKILAEGDWKSPELIFPGQAFPVRIERNDLTEQVRAIDVDFIMEDPWTPVADEELPLCLEKEFRHPGIKVLDLKLDENYMSGRIVNETDHDFYDMGIYYLFYSGDNQLVHSSMAVHMGLLKVDAHSEKEFSERICDSVSKMPEYSHVEALAYGRAHK